LFPHWLGIVGLEAGHVLEAVARDRRDRCLAIEDLEVAVVDSRGDRGAGVGLADPELLAGGLDAALAGDPALDQRRPLRSLQRTAGRPGALEVGQPAGRDGRGDGLDQPRLGNGARVASNPVRRVLGTRSTLPVVVGLRTPVSRWVMPFSRQIRSNSTSAGRGLPKRPVNWRPYR
jgi:hypothetical protein